MKKVICIIAVFALAAPVFADPNVQIICEVVSHDTETNTGTIQVSMNAKDIEGLVRGLALDITLVGDGCTPTYRGIEPGTFKEGISTSDDKGYGIFPGALKDLGGPAEPGNGPWGEPQAPEDHPGAKGGEGDSQFTVELASLYDPEAPEDAPDPCCVLFVFNYDCNDCDEFQVNIEGEPLRGGDSGVVNEDAENVELLAEGCEVVCGVPPCPYNGTPDQQAMWVTVGSPPEWCYDCWLCGDASGDCQINFDDVMILFSVWPPLAYGPEGDFSGDGQINFDDVMILFAHWPPLEGCPAEDGCQPCTPEP